MKGFSLVELSIVLVILGLLTGGILAGQSLIRAAELRSISTQYQQFIAATHSFRDKYMALPGDMNNATRFWSRQVNAVSCTTNSAAAVVATGTCDGNNDGLLSFLAGSNEYFQYWRQLALAGLIEGTYSGVQQGAAVNAVIVGTNTPMGKISNSGWHTQRYSITGHGWWFDNDYGNFLTFGIQNNDTHPTRSITPEELWNIDTKMDDGRPGVGKVWATNWNICTNAATSADAATAQYDFSVTARDCSPVFLNVF